MAVFQRQGVYEHRPPCDPSQLSRFRKAIGEAGVEEILKASIDAAVQMKAIQPESFERVIVDSTVQPKAIAYPVDSRLLEIGRGQLVKAAKDVGIALKQTFAREGGQLRRKAGGYAHARQFKRLRKVLKRQKTVLGRLIREVQRKLPKVLLESQPLMDRLETVLQRAQTLRNQRPPREVASSMRCTLQRSSASARARHDSTMSSASSPVLRSRTKRG